MSTHNQLAVLANLLNDTYILMYFLMITKTMHFSPQKTDHCVLCGKEPLVGSFWQQLKLVLNLKLIIKLAPSHCCSCTRPTLSSIYLPASFSASPAFSFSCLSARLLYLPMCQTKNIHSHGWICSISRYIQQNIIKKPTGVQASSEELNRCTSGQAPVSRSWLKKCLLRGASATASPQGELWRNSKDRTIWVTTGILERVLTQDN